MGHAGAIISGGKVTQTQPRLLATQENLMIISQGTAGSKIEALEAAKVIVSPSPAQMGTLLVGAMKGAGMA